MRRREFIAGLGGAAAGWPLAARAQQARRRRIGFLLGISDGADALSRFSAFQQALETFGWVDGRNIEIVARFGAADADRNRAHVAELIALAPDVIVSSNAPSIIALMKGTRTIPIVIANTTDPVALGFVESLSRPGGNVTGFTNFEQATATKWLELLLEIAPGLIRVAVLVDPRDPPENPYVLAIRRSASSLGIALVTAYARDVAETEQALDALAQQPNGGLIVPPGAGPSSHRQLVLGLAARYRLPAIYGFSDWVAAGGLISYGPDVLDLYRQPASYVDRILKGAKPADLPVQQPSKFGLVINLKTAKALGLTIPETLLATADEVIQ
jgi:putative tryptophan/tyrosine transport system substrate-binding protein